MPDLIPDDEKKEVPPPQEIGESVIVSSNIDDVLNADGTVKEQ